MQGSVTFGVAFLTSAFYFLRLEISTIIDSDRKAFEAQQNQPTINAEVYDFVIVGGGTSGCILARRLSRHHRVLLVEAGPKPPTLSKIPALWYIFSNTTPSVEIPLRKSYYTIPQKIAFNRTIPVFVGNVLGGGYSINAMAVNRGVRYDYDNWANILDDQSFRYTNMLKYFKRVENYTGEFRGRDHGTHGLIQVERDDPPISDIWYSAGRELGYRRGNPNGIRANIFAPIELSRRQGRRATTYSEYVEPILSTRKNLKVVSLAFVEKVIFSGKNATGVVYKRHGKIFEVKALKEVILTAGTFGTVGLLFTSGVGPGHILRKGKIPIVADVPVGQHYEDHVGIILPIKSNATFLFEPLVKRLTKEDINKYVNGEQESILSETGDGPQAFFVSSLANTFKGRLWRDSQLFISQSRLQFSYTRPAHNNKTIGKVKLNTDAYLKGEREPSKLLTIDVKLFENKRIMKVLAEGLTIIQKIVNTKAFASIGAELVPLKECVTHNKLYSKKYWNCYIKTCAGIHGHPAGTCRMGKSRQHGVVDTKFRVFGVIGLRVADASVIPKIPSSNSNTATAAMAERAAEEILNKYGKHKNLSQIRKQRRSR